jgi:outer-membrane receptor for ferric coprogen and ferric-rhodotorulic acid
MSSEDLFKEARILMMGTLHRSKSSTKRTALATFTLGVGMSVAIAQVAEEDATAAAKSEKPIEQMTVYGEQGKTTTATKLDLTIFETPQTVTAISRAQMDDFALNTISDVLDYTPGVTVEEVETDRIYYTARGFDIVNFQYDGVGVPFIYGLNKGQQDTAVFEKIEVVKGAAGLITGLANPSATINYLRKRPTDDLQMGARISANEWNGVRLDGDISGPVTEGVSARLVVARDQSESYLDRHEDEMDLMYGVVEVELTEASKLTVGHSYNKSANTGVLWGALPLLYSDGSRTDYDVSTNNAPDWTFADTVLNQTFVELAQQLSDRWTLNAQFMRNTADFESELFYVYGTPDPVTEVGLNGYASAYDSDEKQNLYDLFVSGSFEFAGREHQLVVGYSYADIETTEASYYDYVNGYPVLGSDWAQGNTPRPSFTDHDPATQSTDIEQTHKSLYFSSRLSLTDRLSALIGARRAELTQEGVSYGGSADTDSEKTVPYYGLTYLLAEDFTLYGSYSEVFKQQTWVNDQFQPLGATEGDNTEVGFKKTFNNERATLSLAYFQSNNENFGEFVARDTNTGTAFYAPRDFESEGFELEFSGEVTEGLNIGAGYTQVDIENDSGKDVRHFVPKKLLKASTSYRLPSLPAMRVGGVIKWQDDITTEDGLVEQEAYTLVDVAVHYDLTPTLGLSVNVDNVTDEKYFSSLYWDQAFYGAPRNVKFAVSWKY